MNNELRVITWNCGGALRKKWKRLSSYDADIIVIQECEDPERSNNAAYKLWAGNYLWLGPTKNKGIGVFVKAGHTIAPIALATPPGDRVNPARQGPIGRHAEIRYAKDFLDAFPSRRQTRYLENGPGRLLARATEPCFENPCVGGSIPPRATKEFIKRKRQPMQVGVFVCEGGNSSPPAHFRCREVSQVATGCRIQAFLMQSKELPH